MEHIKVKVFPNRYKEPGDKKPDFTGQVKKDDKVVADISVWKNEDGSLFIQTKDPYVRPNN